MTFGFSDVSGKLFFQSGEIPCMGYVSHITVWHEMLFFLVEPGAIIKEAH